jgi:hypothetical protein
MNYISLTILLFGNLAHNYIITPIEIVFRITKFRFPNSIQEHYYSQDRGLPVTNRTTVFSSGHESTFISRVHVKWVPCYQIMARPQARVEETPSLYGRQL